jgi:uncharacterized glyoxalase superfamily protein PhnB
MSSQGRVAQVTPNLVVEDVEKLRSFYLEKLGFGHMMGIVGKDGKLDFCIVNREGAMIMLSRPTDRVEGSAQKHATRRPLEIYIEVGDVDGYHDQVRGQVKVSEPLKTQWWGDRNFGVDDPYGYRLWFYKTVQSFDTIQPPEGIKLV